MTKKITKMLTFINDHDGLSAKDALMIVIIFLFSVSFLSGLGMVMIGKELGGEFFALIEVVQPIFITIIGGIMGVQCTEVITKSISDYRLNNSVNDNSEDENDRTRNGPDG